MGPRFNARVESDNFDGRTVGNYWSFCVVSDGE